MSKIFRIKKLTQPQAAIVMLVLAMLLGISPFVWQYYKLTHPVVGITQVALVEELPVATEAPVSTEEEVVAVKQLSVEDLPSYVDKAARPFGFWVYFDTRTNEIVASEDQEWNLSDSCRNIQIQHAGLGVRDLIRIDPFHPDVQDILNNISRDILDSDNWGFEFNPYCTGVGFDYSHLPYTWEFVQHNSAEGVKFPNGWEMRFHQADNDYAVPFGKILVVPVSPLGEEYPGFLISSGDVISATDGEQDVFLVWEDSRAPGNHVRVITPTGHAAEEHLAEGYPLSVLRMMAPCDGYEYACYYASHHTMPYVFMWPTGTSASTKAYWLSPESEDFHGLYHYQELPELWEDYLKSPVVAP
jgi:hypothetical protein